MSGTPVRRGRHRKPGIIKCRPRLAARIRPDEPSAPAHPSQPRTPTCRPSPTIYGLARAHGHRHLRAGSPRPSRNGAGAGTTCCPRTAAVAGGRARRRVLGYAYANHFRPRPAYRFCVEDSIYVDAPTRAARASAALLLAELMARCEACGCAPDAGRDRRLGQLGSIGAARARSAFEPCRRAEAVGWKFERWLDVVIMQRSLGLGAAARPRRSAAP